MALTEFFAVAVGATPREVAALRVAEKATPLFTSTTLGFDSLGLSSDLRADNANVSHLPTDTLPVSQAGMPRGLAGRFLGQTMA